jgi:hypothetical protein
MNPAWKGSAQKWFPQQGAELEIPRGARDDDVSMVAAELKPSALPI